MPSASLVLTRVYVVLESEEVGGSPAVNRTHILHIQEEEEEEEEERGEAAH